MIPGLSSKPTAVPVNPASIRKGDQICTKVKRDSFGILRAEKTHKVGTVGTGLPTSTYGPEGRTRTVNPGSCKPECVHIDGECYDTRFAMVYIPATTKLARKAEYGAAARANTSFRLDSNGVVETMDVSSAHPK